MRFVTRDPVSLDNPSTDGRRALKVSKERKQALATYLQLEIENALSDRGALERVWNQERRDYYQEPMHATRDIPYLNASNYVAPLAQIACDAIFATVFSVTTEASPIITVKASNDAWQAQAKVVQERIDHELNSEGEATIGGLHWNFLPSLYHGGKDCVKLGTAFWSVEWKEQLIKGKFVRVESAGSRIEPIPLENILAPGGASYDLQNLPWIGVLYEYTDQALTEEAERQGWDLDGVRAAGNISTPHQDRERFARQYGNATRTNVNDVYKISCCYDIDDDGETEDLLVYYNHTGACILKLDWHPYDHRNLIGAHFDIEEFMLYGRGVPAIIREATKLASDALNSANDNALLSNARGYKGPIGAIEGNSVLVFPGFYFASTDPEKISELKLSDINPSILELLQVAIGFAERATGINDLSTARPSQIPGRTPATTTMNMLAQVSQRHTPFFASFRSAGACMVRECLYREQERLLRGDTRLPQYLDKILGVESSRIYQEALADPDFDNALSVELTVTSAQMNKEVERQNAIMLAQIYKQYVSELVQAVALVSQPQVTPALRDVVQKAIIASNEFMERVLRTFSDVSNPSRFIIDPTQELQQLAQGGPAAQPQNPLMALIQGLGQGQNGNGTAAPVAGG
jgi:hypothetical protein